jgi:hypothetical protein
MRGDPSGGRRALKVELARSIMTITVAVDKSILDAVEDAGVLVLWSCQEGTCCGYETPAGSRRRLVFGL